MIWKDIPQWEEFYEVNTLGEVRSKRTNKLIVGDVNNAGYYRVCLYNGAIKKRCFRHRLVALTFLDNPNNLPQVNHIDGDKSNNRLENLEWVNQIDNEIHAIKNGLKGSWRGEFKVIYFDGKEEVWDNQKAFARYIGTNSTKIRYWLNKNVKTYFKYNIKEIYFCNKSSKTIESLA